MTPDTGNNLCKINCRMYQPHIFFGGINILTLNFAIYTPMCFEKNIFPKYPFNGNTFSLYKLYNRKLFKFLYKR